MTLMLPAHKSYSPIRNIAIGAVLGILALAGGRFVAALLEDPPITATHVTSVAPQTPAPVLSLPVKEKAPSQAVDVTPTPPKSAKPTPKPATAPVKEATEPVIKAPPVTAPQPVNKAKPKAVVVPVENESKSDKDEKKSDTDTQTKAVEDGENTTESGSG